MPGRNQLKKPIKPVASTVESYCGQRFWHSTFGIAEEVCLAVAEVLLSADFVVVDVCLWNDFIYQTVLQSLKSVGGLDSRESSKLITTSAEVASSFPWTMYWIADIPHYYHGWSWTRILAITKCANERQDSVPMATDARNYKSQQVTTLFALFCFSWHFEPSVAGRLLLGAERLQGLSYSGKRCQHGRSWAPSATQIN